MQQTIDPPRTSFDVDEAVKNCDIFVYCAWDIGAVKCE